MQTLDEIRAAEKARKEFIINQLREEIHSPSINIGVINESFVSIKCESIADMVQTLNAFKPDLKLWDIGHPKKQTIRSKYKVTHKNNFNDPELCIAFYIRTRLFGVTLKLTEVMVDSVFPSFIWATQRNLYEIERHYVANLNQHQFRQHKVKSYKFKFESVSWYGGNIDLIEGIYEFIQFLKGQEMGNYYIEYLKMDSMPQGVETKVEFKSYADAIVWGRSNLDNFHIDMIKLERTDEKSKSNDTGITS